MAAIDVAATVVVVVLALAVGGMLLFVGVRMNKTSTNSVPPAIEGGSERAPVLQTSVESVSFEKEAVDPPAPTKSVARRRVERTQLKSGGGGKARFDSSKIRSASREASDRISETQEKMDSIRQRTRKVTMQQKVYASGAGRNWFK